MFYVPEDGKVRCGLCNHFCLVKEGHRGICGVRENRDGVLFSLVFGKTIANHVDPIEKKPLFHFLPGSRSYSIATAGCNFRCLNCQNWEISQISKGEDARIVGREFSPQEIVEDAQATRCASIAYTYTEPTIYFEYAFETAKRAHVAGLKNVFVTNGYTSSEALRTVAPYLDAANVDLKSFSDEFYRKVCGAKLQPVLDTISLYRELGIWLEITTLLIPGYSDDAKQLKQIASFICSVGDDIPWHISAFYPAYKLPHVEPTKVTALRKAREIGLEAGLRYVYEGNVPGEGGESSFCHSCGGKLIDRFGYTIRKNALVEGKCPKCKTTMAGVGL